MVTAESKVDNVVAAKRAGVDNYIVKPFSAEALRAKVDEVFAAADESFNADPGTRAPARPASARG
jgi:DNA-binding response OmpR family regulator